MNLKYENTSYMPYNSYNKFKKYDFLGVKHFYLGDFSMFFKSNF